MYGPSQARSYAYVPRTSNHQHTASASASYPYPTHRPPEGHSHSASRSVSPTVLRSRPRAGASAAVSTFDSTTSGLGARGSKQHNWNPAYITSAGASTHDASPTRRRAHSQTQSQPRSRSPRPQAQMYAYPYAQRTAAAAAAPQRQPLVPGTHAYAGEDGRVLLDMDATRRSLEREMERERRAAPASYNGSDARVRAAYVAEGTGSVSHNHAYAYEQEYSGHERRRPPQNGLPPGYEDYVQPLAPPPPAMPDGWPRSTASSYATQALGEYERGVYPPPRAPSPASHYPFANYGSTASNGNTYGVRASERRESQAQGRRPSNARDGYARPSYPTATASSQADSTASDPLIHNALGWWPDQRRPALQWDLSSSSPPRYTKRPFDAAELAAPPFTPPLSRMRLVLDPHAHWAFDLAAPRGERYITLSSLLSDIASLMHAPNKVPHAFWVRANPRKKETVLRAMLRRTGHALPVVPPHRRPKTRGQIMEEAVVEAAPNGYTNLLVVDLLCEDVMFAGMEFHKEPDEWVLRTTRR